MGMNEMGPGERSIGDCGEENVALVIPEAA